MPLGRTSGTVTVNVAKFSVNFSESFVPMRRTSGTVTVNVAKFSVEFLRSFRFSCLCRKTSGLVTVNIVNLFKFSVSRCLFSL